RHDACPTPPAKPGRRDADAKPLPGCMNTPSSLPSVLDLARMIDHSLLHPTMTDAQLRDGLALARRCGCATACVKPYAVPMSRELLAGSETAVCSVVGFPHGNSHPELIIAEAERALGEGAIEIDM